MILIMRKIVSSFLCSLMLAGIPVAADAADWKVVERSVKNVPVWVGAHTPETILVTVEAPSLEEARSQAVMAIQRRIIQSVATNVSFEMSQNSSEDFSDGDVRSSESMKSHTEIVAAKLPFIKGVSLSQATDTYWEKLEDKKRHITEYRLNVLYPLPAAELESMRSQYEEEDSARENRMNELSANLCSVRSAAGIQSAMGELKGLCDYFPDATRRGEAARLEKEYAAILKRVEVSAQQTGAGQCVVFTTLNGEPFDGGGKVTVKSECANRLKVLPADNGFDWVIMFCTEDCLDTEENFLEISYRGKGIKKDIKLPISLDAE